MVSSGLIEFLEPNVDLLLEDRGRDGGDLSNYVVLDVGIFMNEDVAEVGDLARMIDAIFRLGKVMQNSR